MTHPEESHANMIANRRATEVTLRRHGNFDIADHVRENTDRIEAGERPWERKGWQDEA